MKYYPKILLIMVFLCVGKMNAQPLYIQGGTIYTMTGNPIHNGIIRIEEGKITYVGRRITIPGDAPVLDATGKYITPGFISANSHLGVAPESLFTSAHSQPVTPDYNIIDAVNLQDPGFSEAVLYGITTLNIMPDSPRPLPGVGCLLKTGGRHFQSRVLRRESALEINLVQENRPSRGTRERSLSKEVETMLLIRNFLKQASEIKQTRESMTVPYSDYEITGQMQTLLRAINQEIPVMIYARRPTEIERALSLVEDFGFRPVYVGLEDIDQIWERFQNTSIDLVTGPVIPESTLGAENGITLPLVKQMLDRNFRIQLQTGISDEAGSGSIRDMIYQVTQLLRLGFSLEDALKTITIIPAKMFGVSDRIGTIEVGKDADLNIYSELPLTDQGIPDFVFINGEIVTEAQ